MRPADNIKDLIKQTKIKTNPKVNKAVLEELLDLMDNADSKQTSTHQQNIWRTIMENRKTKLAAAVIIIIVALISIKQYTGSVNLTSVTFANTMQHLAAAQTANFDLTIELNKQKPQTSSFLYDTKGYLKQKMANGTINFVDYNTKKVYSLLPDTKTVEIRKINKHDFDTAMYDIFTNFQGLIQQAIELSHGPVNFLGTKKIKGITAYGYRVETFSKSSGLFWNSKGTLTIWADAETDFPLILKWHNIITNITFTASNIKLNTVYEPDELSITIPDDYIINDHTLNTIEPEISQLETSSDDKIDQQANAALEAAIQLGANIPKDKRNKVFRMLSLKEKDLIKGLATYLEYTNGQYPPSLIVNKDFMKNIETIFSEALNQSRIDKQTSEEKILDLFYAGSFYGKLIREKKDPVYYGATSTIYKPETILVRWKLSKNKYRLIYSNLKAETVTAERLAELENKQ